MSTLTINFTAPDPAPAEGYIVQYRIKGSGATYTVAQVDGPSPVVITGLNDNTNYEGTIVSNCGYAPSTLMRWQTANCFCPDGYTVSPDGTYCYQELSQDATYTGGSNPYQACHFTYNQYSMYGAAFYKVGAYNPDGTWTTAPNIYSTLGPGSVSGANMISYPSGPFINPSENLTDGRLNTSGLWVCGNQDYVGTLGFSRQFNLQSSKVYYVGLGADNYASIAFNGNTIVSQNVSTMGSASQFNDLTGSFLFRFWHVYPVQLQSGVNLVQIQGTNSGSVGIFGCEIYDATEAQLVACTSPDQLQQYIVFSTKDVASNSNFDTGNYSCAGFDGSQLVYDAGTNSYSCKKLNTATCS